MPKKPTEPFGGVIFGKDGTVRKHVEQLPAEKAEQERDVAKRFARSLNGIADTNYVAEACAECDHDFWLVSATGKVVVQATEIVSRDYLRPLALEDYLEGRHAFRRVHYESEHRIFGEDETAVRDLILSRLKLKLSKRYAKPTVPFWLLIWTVRTDFPSFYVTRGQHVVSPGVQDARAYLDEKGSGPFDEVWFFNLMTRAHRIWPR